MHARIARIIVATVLVSLVAACTPTPSPSSSPGDKPSNEPSNEPSPSAAPAASPSTPPVAGESIDVDCLALVSLETMYEFDPNFSSDDSFTAEAGSLAATAVAEGGIACGWVRATGGSTIVISASKPGATKLAAIRSDLGIADDGSSFDVVGGVGVLQVIEQDAWITATSDYFAQASDAAPFTDSAVTAL